MKRRPQILGKIRFFPFWLFLRDIALVSKPELEGHGKPRGSEMRLELPSRIGARKLGRADLLSYRSTATVTCFFFLRALACHFAIQISESPGSPVKSFLIGAS